MHGTHTYLIDSDNNDVTISRTCKCQINARAFVANLHVRERTAEPSVSRAETIIATTIFLLCVLEHVMRCRICHRLRSVVIYLSSIVH